MIMYISHKGSYLFMARSLSFWSKYQTVMAYLNTKINRNDFQEIILWQ